jgi:hypothetical protein
MEINHEGTATSSPGARGTDRGLRGRGGAQAPRVTAMKLLLTRLVVLAAPIAIFVASAAGRCCR